MNKELLKKGMAHLFELNPTEFGEDGTRQAEIDGFLDGLNEVDAWDTLDMISAYIDLELIKSFCADIGNDVKGLPTESSSLDLFMNLILSGVFDDWFTGKKTASISDAEFTQIIKDYLEHGKN